MREFSGPTPRRVLSATCSGQREKPRTADDKQPICLGTDLNSAKSRGQHMRVHARPLDLRPPVSPLVRCPPPFTSRFVSCGVVAEATVEVGLVPPCHHARVTVTRRLAGRRDRQCRQCWRCYHRLGGAHCVLFVTRYLRQANFPTWVR